jgi:hypothetical protein
MISETGALTHPPIDTRPAWKQLEIPGSGDKIVLITPDLGPKDGPFPNLLRRDRNNHVIWIATLPDPLATARPDSYVDIQWEQSAIAANSWSGFRVLIDPDTGRIVEGEFTK